MRLLAGVRRLLIRDRGLLTAADQRHLRLALARSQALETVYEFRLRLEKLWENGSQSNETLLQHFKQWCVEAEATGIASLREFSARLQSYALTTA
jgi:stearoyl-CoA desaturase (delta-9 desaturase)